MSAQSPDIVYANWPEGSVNQLYLESLVQKYRVSTFYFDETGTEVIRGHSQPINVPAARKITIKDPPLVRLPLNLRLATKGGNAGWILKLFMRALIFRRFIRRYNPDLLIGNGVSGTNPYGFCCAFSGHHPFIVIAWGSDILVEARNSFLRIVAKFILGRADGIIVDNEVERRAAIALGASKQKIWKFPNGINLELFNTRSDGFSVRETLGWKDNKIIISTRNHYPIYGLEYLILAIPIVVQEIPDARFLIVGEGPSRNVLTQMARNLGVEKYVHFAGSVANNELPSYLKTADIYVSTSFSDGTSKCLLEALACGLPAIVTDIPGNIEWIRGGKNGFLVPAKNQIELAGKIILLARNGKLREHMRDENVKLAKARADWKKNVRILFDAVEKTRVIVKPKSET